jgi:hypothetical protein
MGRAYDGLHDVMLTGGRVLGNPTARQDSDDAEHLEEDQHHQDGEHADPEPVADVHEPSSAL